MREKGYKHKNSRTKSIKLILLDMQIGDKLDKESLIKSLYGEKYIEKYAYFHSRSFDVLFCNVKKELHDRKFVSVDKIITRII